MRFADAVRELSVTNGLQVHRSWWVMKESVMDIQTEAGKKVLVLKSDVKAPISRTYMKQAKQIFSF